MKRMMKLGSLPLYSIAFSLSDSEYQGGGNISALRASSLRTFFFLSIDIRETFQSQ
jgi:hypothetical protein